MGLGGSKEPQAHRATLASTLGGFSPDAADDFEVEVDDDDPVRAPLVTQGAGGMPRSPYGTAALPPETRAARVSSVAERARAAVNASAPDPELVAVEEARELAEVRARSETAAAVVATVDSSASAPEHVPETHWTVDAHDGFAGMPAVSLMFSHDGVIDTVALEGMTMDAVSEMVTRRKAASKHAFAVYVEYPDGDHNHKITRATGAVWLMWARGVAVTRTTRAGDPPEELYTWKASAADGPVLLVACVPADRAATDPVTIHTCRPGAGVAENVYCHLN